MIKVFLSSADTAKTFPKFQRSSPLLLVISIACLTFIVGCTGTNKGSELLWQGQVWVRSTSDIPPIEEVALVEPLSMIRGEPHVKLLQISKLDGSSRQIVFRRKNLDKPPVRVGHSPDHMVPNLFVLDPGVYEFKYKSQLMVCFVPAGLASVPSYMKCQGEYRPLPAKVLTVVATVAENKLLWPSPGSRPNFHIFDNSRLRDVYSKLSTTDVYFHWTVKR